APGAPGMAPGAPGMPPGGPGATAKAEPPKTETKPEPKKPVDLSDDPFASERGEGGGKTTASRALGKALLKTLPIPRTQTLPAAKQKTAP
ncbi:MAG: hypothetical protein NUV77_22310, partial [Thermoguttaceae bacterium]|nr:hypothetical protein [Thermoguttaceae bacterium]